MAKENREAEHMLGRNDTQKKNNNTRKKETQMKRAWVHKNHDKSISQQAAQAMLPSKLPSARPWGALLLFADYVCTERY